MVTARPVWLQVKRRPFPPKMVALCAPMHPVMLPPPFTTCLLKVTACFSLLRTGNTMCLQKWLEGWLSWLMVRLVVMTLSVEKFPRCRRVIRVLRLGVQFRF